MEDVENANDVMSYIRAMQAQIRAIEKAQELFREDMVRVPTAVDRANLSLRELLEAKLYGAIEAQKERDHAIADKIAALFAEVTLRFNERDLRFQQSAMDHKEALAAALTSMRESLAQTRTLAETVEKANNVRLNALEQAKEGLKGERSGTATAVNATIALMAIVVSAIGLLVFHLLQR